jgi:hypothetical protein
MSTFLKRTPQRKKKKKKKGKQQIMDNHSHSCFTRHPRKPFIYTHFALDDGLGDEPLYSTPGAFSKMKPPASKNQRLTDNRSPPRHTPTTPPGPTCPTSHNRTVMQRNSTIYYCHRLLLSNHHDHHGHSHHNDYNALRLNSTVWVDCP